MVFRREVVVSSASPYKIEDGMGDFLSPSALKVIAEDYQQGLLDRLNEQIKYENMSVAQIVISTAPHESQTLAFNYASLALNNSFFLHHLKPPKAKAPNHESALNEKSINPERTLTLSGVIASQMGSLEDLKTYMTAAATGMLSNSGFVWLVTDALGRLGVIATYGAGTLLVDERKQAIAPDGTELGAIYQAAQVGENGSVRHGQSSHPPSSSPTSGIAHPSPPPHTETPLPGTVRAFSTSTRTSKANNHANGGGVVRPVNVWSDTHSFTNTASTGAGASSGSGSVYGSGYGSGYGAGRRGGGGLFGASETPSLDTIGRTLYPLFCVSVNEHAWMAAGYGVWGKEKYLERFWTCLDWAAVRDAYARYALRKQ
ncbi:hypothetical protein B0F90DRAFT_1811359 [Multifurca ochricompacta]|uniref:Manganese/iron superoxide dismutase C-terminal domain-containing protein n=1 Tax=Multifurca ochricompacta TaxID=376703 RepID=A0AAD4LZ90_9AGAM|nr:hypothetical protein B0F90DRAFT_1811359 [Multifurca ochricompacta]